VSRGNAGPGAASTGEKDLVVNAPDLHGRCSQGQGSPPSRYLDSGGPVGIEWGTTPEC
jgi:hypothetical protein